MQDTDQHSLVTAPAPQPGGLRVLMIAPAGSGGTLQYAHNLCNALADCGHQVVLATALECEMAPFARRYQMLGVFDRFTPHLRPLWRFARMVRALKPDIVHLQGAQRPEFYWLMLRCLSFLCNATFVWTPQDVRSNTKRTWHDRLSRRVYGRMAHIFLNAKQNEGAVRDLFGVPQEQITVMPIPDLVAFARDGLERQMPPEISAASSEAPPPPMILCFGLIEPRKGIAELIDAFGAIASQTTARLVIMGKALTDITPYQEALAALDLPAERAILLPRYASFEEMNALFDAASVIVLPYVSGWNSGVLASAYGFGKPVIATRVGGFDEVVADGETGLLVAPGDPDALSKALLQIMTDDPLRADLAKGAAAAGRAASWRDIAAQTTRVYNDILPEPGHD